jgi:tricorn protease interacting factor F2/3
LPDDGSPVIPEYRLELDVDFENTQWSGSVEFDLAPGLHRIELDAEDLDVRSVSCNDEQVRFDLDPRRHRLLIPLPSAGASTVRVEFRGKVDPQRLVGLYRCRHGKGWVLTTQCEPIGARRIFPCVDRPDRKARILLVARAPAELEVVSNTEPERVRVADRSREWTFAPTPPMATYLFYLAVGEFDRAEDRSGRVPVRVLTSPGRGATGRFAAEAGAKILAAYETYYNIPYPLSKLDMLAVAEHAFGAMENWGAMSFRDMRLLLEDSSASNARADVFETVCHEIGHQWFGNLVTMAWWDDIWLNESFATFLEAKITDRIAPEFDPFTDFVLHAWGMRAALDGDSLAATHPVRSTVTEPEEIGQITDEITYGKGASILRMLDHHLGEGPFRAGVTDYLDRFRYRNARTEDLWAALGRSSNSDVTSLVGPWIYRSGLPVIEAELLPSGLRLVQHRFSYHGWSDEPPWPIPLTLEVDGRREHFLFDTRERTVPAPEAATVHLNPGALGFYRVRYSPSLYERLLTDLPGRPSMDRWIVLNDLSTFVVSGDVDWATYARFVRGLGLTTDRVVVEQLVDDLTNAALGLPTVPEFQELTRPYLADVTELLGAERRLGEPAPNRILRERVLRARVRLDAAFARAFSERFVEWNHLDPDLRAAVAIARARTEGESGYREIRRALARPLPEAEALRLEVALAWSGEPTLVASTLDLVSAGAINRGHVWLVVSQAAVNPVGRPLVGPWLERNLPQLSHIYRGSSLLSLLLEQAIPFSGLGRLEETKAYFRDHPFPDGARGITKGLERLELAERLRSRFHA